MFSFMETTHEPLHLDEWSVIQSKNVDLSTSFIWIIILFYKVFKYGNGAKSWNHVRSNAEQLCRIL
jgi:hypothetical protein